MNGRKCEQQDCFYLDFAFCSDPMKLPLPPKIPAGLSEEGGKTRNNNNHYAINFSNTTAWTELSASNLPEGPDSNPTASCWQSSTIVKWWNIKHMLSRSSSITKLSDWSRGAAWTKQGLYITETTENEICLCHYWAGPTPKPLKRAYLYYGKKKQIDVSLELMLSITT